MAETRGSATLTAEALLAPIGVEQFLAECWAQTPLYLTGEKGRFGNLVGWPELNRILEDCPLDATRLRVMRNGKRLSDDLYLTRTKSLDAGALTSLLGQGATLVIDFIDDVLPRMGDIADSVAEALQSRGWINLYASWGTESGLKLHADTHDVFIVQLAGDKQWAVHCPTRLNPIEGDKFEAPPNGAAPAWSGMLSDGDVLYIPRGWPHIAAPTGHPSLHLTIGLAQPTGSAFLRWLADELDSDAEIRAAIPQSGAEQQNWLDRTRRLVEQGMAADSLDAFLRHEVARQLPRRRFALPGVAIIPSNDWTADTGFRLASSRALEVRPCGDGSASVTAAGRQLTCPASIAAALQTLSSNHASRLGTLEDGLGREAVKELRRTLAILAQLGLLFTERAA